MPSKRTDAATGNPSNPAPVTGQTAVKRTRKRSAAKVALTPPEPNRSPRSLQPLCECPGLVEQSITAARGDLTLAYQEWRGLCGLGGVPEFFDLDPDLHRSLTAGLPEEAAEKRTFVETRLWWWRSLKSTNPNDRLRVFRPSANPQGSRNGDYGRLVADAFTGVFDESAFFYELRARYDERNRWEFGVPWPACSLHQRMFLANVWPSKRQPDIFVPGMGKDPRFRNIELPMANVALPEKQLIEQFKDELARTRQRSGMPPKERGGAQHDIPWRNIEIADQRQLLGHVVSDGERSQLNKKQRDYQTACSQIGLIP